MVRARMLLRRIGLAPLLLAAACGAPPEQGNVAAPASPKPTPTVAKPVKAARALCPEAKPAGGADPAKPLAIPPEYRDVVSAEKTRMTVQSLTGEPICVDLAGVSEIGGMLTWDKGRFVEFSTRSAERFGHRLVDRAGKGWAIETGGPPDLSDDRKLIASAQVSGSERGALEAISVWEVGPRGPVQVARIANLPGEEGRDSWNVDSVGPGRCVRVSAVPAQEVGKVNARNLPADAADIALRYAPHDYFLVRPAGGTWRLERVAEKARCG